MGSVKFRKNSFATKLLKGLAISGLILIAATSPYFGVAVLKGVLSRNRKKEWRRVYNSLDRLKKRGLVRTITREEGYEVRVTIKGQKIIDLLNTVESLRLKKNKKWDGKWRVIIFDVPNEKNSKRMMFSQKLKELGFIMVQRSVWAYPLDCYKEIGILRDFYEISKYVTYIETAKVEDDHLWIKHFNLLH